MVSEQQMEQTPILFLYILFNNSTLKIVGYPICIIFVYPICVSRKLTKSLENAAGWMMIHLFKKWSFVVEAWLAEGLSKSKANWQVALTHFPCGHESSFWVAQLQLMHEVCTLDSCGLKLFVSVTWWGTVCNLKSKSMESNEFQFSETNKNNELDGHKLLQHSCNRTWNE